MGSASARLPQPRFPRFQSAHKHSTTMTSLLLQKCSNDQSLLHSKLIIQYKPFPLIYLLINHYPLTTSRSSLSGTFLYLITPRPRTSNLGNLRSGILPHLNLRSSDRQLDPPLLAFRFASALGHVCRYLGSSMQSPSGPDPYRSHVLLLLLPALAFFSLSLTMSLLSFSRWTPPGLGQATTRLRSGYIPSDTRNQPNLPFLPLIGPAFNSTEPKGNQRNFNPKVLSPFHQCNPDES